MTAATTRREIPVAEQRQRITALDMKRLNVGLTIEERAEADNLAHRAYMRSWRL